MRTGASRTPADVRLYGSREADVARAVHQVDPLSS